MVVNYRDFLSWAQQYMVSIQPSLSRPVDRLGGLEHLALHDAVPTQHVLILDDDMAICYGSHLMRPEQLGESILLLQSADPQEYGAYPILARINRQENRLSIIYTHTGYGLVEQRMNPKVKRTGVQGMLPFEGAA